MAVRIQRLHHCTLRCQDTEIEALREFYESVLGLTVGPRPRLRVPGYWLYADGAPLVHLFISDKAESPANTGLDHLAFLAHDLAASRQYLIERGIAFQEAPVPDWPLHQIFVRDPLGVKLELTFEIDKET